MRARWRHYVAAWVMCLSGIAVIASRAHVVYRDPNMRSCRVYGLCDGFFFAHTHGSGTPSGLAFEYGPQWSRGPHVVGEPFLFGAYEYRSLDDPNAEYGSDWAVVVPLWLPWYVCLPLLVPFLRERAAINMQRCERRRAIGRRTTRRAALRSGGCPTCGYSLQGLSRLPPRSACPECGEPLTSRQAR